MVMGRAVALGPLPTAHVTILLRTPARSGTAGRSGALDSYAHFSCYRCWTGSLGSIPNFDLEAMTGICGRHAVFICPWVPRPLVKRPHRTGWYYNGNIGDGKNLFTE